MYIKVKINDPLMKSCVLPIACGSSSVTKVIDGTKLEVKEIDYVNIFQTCNGKKVEILQIDAKEFKENK